MHRDILKNKCNIEKNKETSLFGIHITYPNQYGLPTTKKPILL